MLTIADALTEPCMQAAELLAGHSGLAHPLRWVHSAEVLYIAKLLEGGELLLSTGLSLSGKSEQTHHNYLESLSSKKISALCFELSSDFNKLPFIFYQWSNYNNIPLLVFRTEVSFSAIAQRLAQKILAYDRDSTRSSIANEDIATFNKLEPLLRLPGKKRDRLIETLHVLLQQHFNMSKTARRLGLRRQSLYYRYTQLEELLGDLRANPELGSQLLIELNRNNKSRFFDTLSVERNACNT